MPAEEAIDGESPLFDFAFERAEKGKKIVLTIVVENDEAGARIIGKVTGKGLPEMRGTVLTSCAECYIQSKRFL
jgi:hypothetical protein